MSTAQLNNYRQSPRKVRLIADMARGRKVKEVFPVLDNLNKRAAEPIKKLLKSAVANAVHNESLDKDKLVISEIRVDEGVTLKRWRPRARGRAFPIRKRTSRVMVRLTEAIKEKKTTIEKTTTATKAKEEDKDLVEAKNTNK